MIVKEIVAPLLPAGIMESTNSVIIETWVGQEIWLPSGKLAGKLMVEQPPGVYGTIPRLVARFVVFQDKNGGERRIQELCQLAELSTIINFSEEAKKQPLAFAILFSFLEDFGVVVDPSIRFSTLSSYGVDLHSIRPEVTMNTLSFVTVTMGMELKARPMSYVEVNLESFRHHARKVMDLEELVSGARKWPISLDE